MPWAQQAPSIEEEGVVIGRMELGWLERTDFVYAVVLSPTGPIGAIGLHTRQGPGTLEIGYWIAALHTGRGYATAAARALAVTALALPSVDLVQIRCDEANQASAAVPRKLGFRLVETITRKMEAPAETGRGMIWAARRGEWPANR
jgi:RimJ/RimL family protein N-acetyltransferase